MVLFNYLLLYYSVSPIFDLRGKPMKKMIQKLAYFLSEVLRRVITDSIKQLLRCFLESIPDAELVA